MIGEKSINTLSFEEESIQFKYLPLKLLFLFLLLFEYQN